MVACAHSYMNIPFEYIESTHMCDAAHSHRENAKIMAVPKMVGTSFGPYICKVCTVGIFSRSSHVLVSEL